VIVLEQRELKFYATKYYKYSLYSRYLVAHVH